MSVNPTQLPIRVEFTLSQADYVGGSLRALLSMLRWFFVVAILMPLIWCACLAYSLRSNNGEAFELSDQLVPTGLSFAIPAFGLYALFATYLTAKRKWAKEPSLRGPYGYEFCEAGYAVRGPLGDSFVSWETLQYVKQSGPIVLLKHAHAYPFLLPVRAFRDSTEWDTFHRLVRTSVRRTRLGSAGAISFTGATGAANRDDLVPGSVLQEAVYVPTDTGVARGTEMSVDFTPSLTRFLLALVLVSLPFVAIALVFLVFAISLWISDVETDEGFPLWVLAVVPPLVFFALLSFSWLRAVRTWLRSPEMHEPRTFLISEGGIDMVAKSFTRHVNWSAVSHARRRWRLLFLYSGKTMLISLPVKAIQPDDWQRLCELMERKVPRLPAYLRVGKKDAS